MQHVCFNPHPSRGTGATFGYIVRVGIGNQFQSSPVPKDGCNCCRMVHIGVCRVVSILTRPEGRVQQAAGVAWRVRRRVSILTRPEGRVQRFSELLDIPAPIVSILTRPEGRVQLAGHACSEGRRQGSFNPHPSRRTGATSLGSLDPRYRSMFQSSPVPKDGCNLVDQRRLKNIRLLVSILTRPEGRVQPSPA